MRLLEDCFGRPVRLTDERLTHILEHPEMAGMEAELVRVLRQPPTLRAPVPRRATTAGARHAGVCRKAARPTTTGL